MCIILYMFTTSKVRINCSNASQFSAEWMAGEMEEERMRGQMWSRIFGLVVCGNAFICLAGILGELDYASGYGIAT